MAEAARSLEQRKVDSLGRLETDKDLWIATGDLQGDPCLVPLSFWWNGTIILVTTVKTNPTGRNMAESKHARVALGHPRDVILIDVSATLVADDALPSEYGDAYTAKCGWDPRESKTYKFFELEPLHIEAWREFNEHPNRVLMDGGRWLV